jgi:YesN/AraC family two-component response regulator
MAKEYTPDLIITDWMMPNMNGVELCHQLKTHELTSHIPVILLTAKATVENKLEGLQTGADDYVTKPFHTDELFTRAKNLIAGRKKLWEHFSRNVTSQPSGTSNAMVSSEGLAVSINSLDEQFLLKLAHAIEARISEAELSIEYLEKEVGMSHSQLYRKLKALTNQSPGEFLRNYRLKKAAEMLSQKQGNVSQIAYDVGFSNLSYFTRSFRQMYGVPPSEYTGPSIQVNQP